MSTINAYIQRAIEEVIKQSFANNKIVSLLGARQCGKSTVIEHLYPNIEVVSLKTDFMAMQARNNPDSFIKGLKIPSFINEALKAPEIFGSLQEAVDKNNFYSQFILPGSNKQKLDEKNQRIAFRKNIDYRIKQFIAQRNK